MECNIKPMATMRIVQHNKQVRFYLIAVLPVLAGDVVFSLKCLHINKKEELNDKRNTSKIETMS